MHVDGAVSFIGNDLHRSMWESVVSKMPDSALNGLHLTIWDWSFLNEQRIHYRFPYEEYGNLIVSKDGLRPVLLIDSLNEAPQYAEHIEPLVQVLSENGMTSRKDIIHCTGGAMEPQGVIKLLSYGAFALGHPGSPPTDSWKHHFVMLNRVPKPLRVMCSVNILRRGLDKFGYISCGVNKHATVDRQWIENLVPYELRPRFPLVLDGETIDDFTNTQFSVDDDRIRYAAVNVISETSQDKSLRVPDPWSVWNDVFITEKTAKAFRLCQLPLWVAVPGTVANVRSRGFDVFDDLIDHSYDSISNPEARMLLVADQLENICGRSMEELAELRHGIEHRLRANQKLANDTATYLTDDLAARLSSVLHGIYHS